MAFQLSQDEKIIKSYDYATIKKLSLAKTSGAARNLTVTNKRVIHTEATESKSTSAIAVREMPIESVKYVNTYYGKKSLSIFLVLAVLFAIFAIVAFAAFQGSARFIGAIVCAVVAVIFFIVYKFKKDYSLSCEISTDKFIVPAMGFEVNAGNSFFQKMLNRYRRAEAKSLINVKVRINREVARVMAEELGAVILDAQKANENA